MTPSLQESAEEIAAERGRRLRRGQERVERGLYSIEVHFVPTGRLRAEITHREGNSSKRTVTIERQYVDAPDPHHPDAPDRVLIRALEAYAAAVLG